MAVTTEQIKELREITGAGIMDCKRVLEECKGDQQKAVEALRKKGIATLAKKADRVATQGLVQSYVHFSNRIGAMVEVNCETDFVANTPEFKELAHNVALHIAACEPLYITEAEIPAGSNLDPEKVCLLKQKFVKDESRTINDLITDTVAKVRENITIRRFARYEVGK